MAGLTFLQLQTAVMGTRFTETQRGDVMTWINSAYWKAWSAERWTFRNNTDLVTVTANSNVVTGITADLQRVESLERSNGDGLQYLEPRRFYARYYNTTVTAPGIPEAYTIIGGQPLNAGRVVVGPVSSETKSDYLLTYEMAYTALSADGDVPALPEGCHLDVLVFGALSTGLKTENDFTWSFFAQQYQEALDALRSDYLSDESDDDAAYPADPLGVSGYGLY